MTPEIEKAIADIRTLSDQIEVGGVTSPAQKLLDLSYRAIGIIVMSDPAGFSRLEKRKRQRRPSLADEIKRAEKAGKHVTGSITTPDGVTLTYGDGQVTSPERLTPEGELERWRKKKNAR